MSILHALDRPIAFHRIFAQITGSVCTGLFLSQAWYWCSRTKDPSGWFYKTAKEWEEETVLTRKQQQTARKKLVELEIIEEELRGWPAQTYYRVNKKRLETLIYQQMGNNEPLDGQKGQTEWAKGTNRVGKRDKLSIYTENTTENTSYDRWVNVEEIENDQDFRLSNVHYPWNQNGRRTGPINPKFNSYLKEVMPNQSMARSVWTKAKRSIDTYWTVLGHWEDFQSKVQKEQQGDKLKVDRFPHWIPCKEEFIYEVNGRFFVDSNGSDENVRHSDLPDERILPLAKILEMGGKHFNFRTTEFYSWEEQRVRKARKRPLSEVVAA